MVSILAILQIVVCVFLILLIMIQDPKGGGSGLFSGGSNSLIGQSGGADFLTKLTRYVGVVFGVLCIALTIVTKPSGTGVFSKMPAAPVEQTAPVAAPGGEVAPATQPAAAQPTPPATPDATKPAEKK